MRRMASNRLFKGESEFYHAILRGNSRGVRVVGIDLGERRIGVAVSDASGTLARPLKTIERGASDADAVERLQRGDCGARGRR